MLPHTTTNEAVVVFDGVCKLCNAWSNFIIKYDHLQTIKLCSAQSDQGQAILHHLGLCTDDYESMLYLKGNKHYIKADAFFRIVSHLGAPWKLLTVFSIFPTPVINWFYDQVAKNRYRLFGKYEHCAVPSPEHSKHYLDAKQ